MKNVFAFVKKHWMVSVAFSVAALSTLVTPPDVEYLHYIDWSTITILYVMMAVLIAYRHIYFFEIISKLIVKHVIHTRRAVFTIVFTTFIASMLIANDMALLTFLPLTLLVFQFAKKENYIAFTMIMQTIAANLGGMLTPFGNPQNLYLYNYFQIANGEFFAIMFFPFILSIIAIAIILSFVKKEPLQDMTIQLFEGSHEDLTQLPKEGVPVETIPTLDLKSWRVLLYTALFTLTVVMVFRFIPIYVGAAIVIATLLFTDRKALIKIDWDLLFTFIFFFIFSSNMSRDPNLQATLGQWVQQYTLLASVVSCQFISNVPSAILLSQFTTNYSDLLRGVNIGGVGTLLSSLASLIALRHFIQAYPQKKWQYIGLFSILNFSFLISLTLILLFL